MIKKKISTRHLVPIIFLIICLGGFILSGAQLGFITSELANRLVRNTFWYPTWCHGCPNRLDIFSRLRF